MTTYLVNFSVTMENDATDINMFRAIIAKDVPELMKRCKILETSFEGHYNELWELQNFWQIPDIPDIEHMNKFFLTDDLTGWNDRPDQE